MDELFYNFCFGETNHGYYYLRQQDNLLFSEAKFCRENELYTNTFSVKHDGSSVLAYKYGDEAWVDFTSQSAHHFPTSAYPLLLPNAFSKPYVYTAIAEGDGSVLGETILVSEGNEIVETRKGQVVRRFTLEKEVPVAIDWGGPVSHLCTSAAEAVKGSDVTFSS